MANQKIFVSEMDIDWATDIDARWYDNLQEEKIPSIEFDDYVDAEIVNGEYWLTVNLEFPDIDQWRYSHILSENKRHKLMSGEEYSTLRKALNIFDSVMLEFYIDSSSGDVEFSLKFIV